MQGWHRGDGSCLGQGWATCPGLITTGLTIIVSFLIIRLKIHDIVKNRQYAGAAAHREEGEGSAPNPGLKRVDRAARVADGRPEVLMT